MKLESLINHSANLLEIILKSTRSADSVTSQYFREKKYIGSTDRKFISEAVFTALRIKSLSEFCFDELTNSTQSKLIDYYKNNAVISEKLKYIIIITIIIGHYYRFSPEKIIEKNSYFNENNDFTNLINEISGIEYLVEKVELIYSELLTMTSKKLTENIEYDGKDIDLLAHRYSIQSWILNSWINNFSYFEAIAIAESLMYPAEINLRVNTKIIDLNTILDILIKTGINAEISKISPVGIIINERVNLFASGLINKGLAELQDVGSQLISFAVNPNENDTVLDACAGAGGKTLHLATLMHDKGKIIATDIEFSRLKEIKHRAFKAGIKSINPVLIKPKGTSKEHKQNFDAVLVDAPCSGIGTARRMPMLKWRLNESMLKRLAQKQLQILEHNSQFVKQGGVLVYATCSLMKEENEDIIKSFLDRNKEFRPDSLFDVFKSNKINLEGLCQDDFMVNLLPSVHKTDGFFIARMIKI